MGVPSEGWALSHTFPTGSMATNCGPSGACGQSARTSVKPVPAWIWTNDGLCAPVSWLLGCAGEQVNNEPQVPPL